MLRRRLPSQMWRRWTQRPAGGGGGTRLLKARADTGALFSRPHTLTLVQTAVRSARGPLSTPCLVRHAINSPSVRDLSHAWTLLSQRCPRCSCAAEHRTKKCPTDVHHSYIFIFSCGRGCSFVICKVTRKKKKKKKCCCCRNCRLLKSVVSQQIECVR